MVTSLQLLSSSSWTIYELRRLVLQYKCTYDGSIVRSHSMVLERSQKYKYSFCAYSNSPMTSAKCDFPQKNANLCNQGPPICTRLEHAWQILALPVLIFANFCVGFVLLKYTTRDPKSKHPPNNNRASTHLQCYLAVHMYSSTCSLYDILQSTTGGAIREGL